MPAAGFNAGMQPPSTPVRNEYLMANGYDPALDEGLPSAALTNGIPSIVPSEAYGANFGMGAPPPMPVMQQAGQGTLRKGVTFTSEEPTLHVYRDSVTSAATSSDIGFRQ
ncbi:hypothetical protein HK101_002900 [Irineochytrium annulatum]|nr:hypothetical protein HK101_002900 [Irineochytrium annulatum]